MGTSTSRLNGASTVRRFRCQVAAGLALALLAGCNNVPGGNLLWIDADASTIGLVISSGIGQELTLGCNATDEDAPCEWSLSMHVRNVEPLNAWSANLRGGVIVGASIEVTSFEYSDPTFDTPLPSPAIGSAPSLILGAGAASTDTNGVPRADHTVANFTLVMHPPPNFTGEIPLYAGVGAQEWTRPDGEVPDVRFAGNNPVPAEFGADLPEPVIVIRVERLSEICNDNIDNDGDGLIDCADPACRRDPQCRAAPMLTCPEDETVECDGSGNATDLASWLDSAKVDSVCAGLAMTDDFQSFDDGCGAAGQATVTWVAIDDCGVDQCSATFRIEDTMAPTITAPGSLVFQCDESGEQTELKSWLASPKAIDGCGPTTVTFRRTEGGADCTAKVTWTATDECGNAASTNAFLAVSGDQTPPELSPNGGATVNLECGIERYVELGARIIDTCDATLVTPTIGGDGVDANSTGVYVVTYGAVDICGHASAPTERVVSVLDSTGPDITIAPIVELGPTTGAYRSLRLSDCVTSVFDACEGTLDVNTTGIIISIYSDEPEGSGAVSQALNDIVINGNTSFQLRVDREDGGNGRVYGVRFRVDDASGNASEATCLFGVPLDQSGVPPVDDGPAAGYWVEWVR